MPRKRKDFSKPKVLFVEGLDEVNVVDSIVESLGIVDSESVDVGGRDKLSVDLPSAVKEATFLSIVKSFGIIQDADDDSNAAFGRVIGLLQKLGMPCPQHSGAFAKNEKFRVGVLVLPGGDRRGFLEDIFLTASDGTLELQCVDGFSQCCVAAGRPAFESKRRAHALLVALEAPENRLGQAFKSGRVRADSPAYDVLKD